MFNYANCQFKNFVIQFADRNQFGSGCLSLHTKKKIGIFIAGLILSAGIALISVVFLIVEHLASELLWQKLMPTNYLRIIYTIIVAFSCATLVGYLHRKWGALPQTAEASLAELRTHKTVDYHNVFQSLLLAVLILAGGAGVGPEAGLLGAVVALSVWESDKLRYFYFADDEVQQLSWWQLVRRLLTPTRYLLTYDQERSEATHQLKMKKLFDLLFIINGLVMFAVLMKFSGQPSFITKMGQSNWQLQELWLLPLLLLCGWLFGRGYLQLEKWLQRLFNFWQQRSIAKAWLGALAIILVALLAPNLLFSGQISIALAPFMGQEKSFLFLMAAAILKLIFLQVCLNTGWRGGDIFPITFAAIIAGFAVAQLLPQFDHLFIVVIVATSSLIVMLEKPLLAAIFIALFFPINLWPIILLILIVFIIGQRLWRNLSRSKVSD